MASEYSMIPLSVESVNDGVILVRLKLAELINGYFDIDFGEEIENNDEIESYFYDKPFAIHEYFGEKETSNMVVYLNELFTEYLYGEGNYMVNLLLNRLSLDDRLDVTVYLKCLATDKFYRYDNYCKLRCRSLLNEIKVSSPIIGIDRMKCIFNIFVGIDDICIDNIRFLHGLLNDLQLSILDVKRMLIEMLISYCANGIRLKFDINEFLQNTVTIDTIRAVLIDAERRVRNFKRGLKMLEYIDDYRRSQKSTDSEFISYLPRSKWEGEYSLSQMLDGVNLSNDDFNDVDDDVFD